MGLVLNDTFNAISVISWKTKNYKICILSLLRKARSTKEQKPRLVGSEPG
jgi:hypothetical protein